MTTEVGCLPVVTDYTIVISQAPLRPKLDRPLNERLLAKAHPLVLGATHPGAHAATRPAHPAAGSTSASPGEIVAIVVSTCSR